MKTSQVQREPKVKTSNLLKAREDAGEQVKNCLVLKKDGASCRENRELIKNRHKKLKEYSLCKITLKTDILMLFSVA